MVMAPPKQTVIFALTVLNIPFSHPLPILPRRLPRMLLKLHAEIIHIGITDSLCDGLMLDIRMLQELFRAFDPFSVIYSIQVRPICLLKSLEKIPD